MVVSVARWLTALQPVACVVDPRPDLFDYISYMLDSVEVSLQPVDFRYYAPHSVELCVSLLHGVLSSVAVSLYRALCGIFKLET